MLRVRKRRRIGWGRTVACASDAKSFTRSVKSTKGFRFFPGIPLERGGKGNKTRFTSIPKGNACGAGVRLGRGYREAKVASLSLVRNERKNVVKKILALALVLALTVGGIVGCEKPMPTQPQRPNSAPAGGSGTGPAGGN